MARNGLPPDVRRAATISLLLVPLLLLLSCAFFVTVVDADDCAPNNGHRSSTVCWAPSADNSLCTNTNSFTVSVTSTSRPANVHASLLTRRSVR